MLKLKTKLPQNINSLYEAQVFLKEMYANNETFDPDIPPTHWRDDQTGEKLSSMECFHLDILILQMKSLGIDIALEFWKMDQEVEEEFLADWDEKPVDMEFCENLLYTEGAYKHPMIGLKFTGFCILGDELIVLN